MGILGRMRQCLVKGLASAVVSVLLSSVGGAQATQEGASPHQNWAQEFEAQYPGLLAEFGQLFKKLQSDVQFPAARRESRLLPLLPESTMSYGAFPNYGEAASQALAVFREELKESSVLREWGQHGQAATVGPKIEDSLAKVSQLNQYLGEEIAVSGTMEGKEPNLLIVAEIRKPGLQKYLQRMIADLAGRSKPGVLVLDPQALAAAETKPAAGDLLILVRPDFVVAALDLPTLRKFNSRLDQANRGFAATPFGHRVDQAYAGGVTMLAAADLQKLLSKVPQSSNADQMTLQRSGFSDMKFLVWDHTRLNGQTVSEAELSFTGPRRAAAAWLAKPAPIGSLDYVSPKAIVAGTVVLANPTRIFDDYKELMGAASATVFANLAQAEQVVKLSLRDDLLACLSGEVTLELDSVTPPKPEWRAILKVSDSKHLQQTLSSLLKTAQFRAEEFEEEETTISTVEIPNGQSRLKIGYAIVDGYWILGSSREAVANAVHLHASGGSLGKSKKFLAALPPNHTAEASALFYQDPIAMASLQLRGFSPEMAKSLAEAGSEHVPGLIAVYGEDSAIREASRGGDFDVPAMLIVAAIAIPNLLRSKGISSEAAALGMTRTVNTAQVTYAATYPNRGFAPDLATLGPDPHQPASDSPSHANLINETLGNASCTGDGWCTKSGYQFRMTAACKLRVCNEYVVVATPVSANTGMRSFCSASDGVIHFKISSPLIAPVSVAECRTWAPLR